MRGLEQARATAVIAGAGRVPSLSWDGRVSASEQRRRGADGNFSTVSSERYALGLAAGYELDLWGRARSKAGAARLDREASASDLRAVALTLSAEVALRWLELLQQRETLDVLQVQLAANLRVLDLTELRFRNAQATALDVLQQRDSVARTRALMPPEEAREQVLLHELATLFGKAAGTDLEIEGRRLPDLPPLPATGLPVELLARRPDLQAAALRLRSADRRLDIARADRLPQVRLGLSGGFDAEALGDLLDSRVQSLLADLTGPIFDAGARKAEVERTRAVVAEQMAIYHETVLKAVQEVENALVSEARQTDLIAALEERLKTSRQTYTEAAARYRYGASDFLPVLAAELAQQETQRARIRAGYQRLAFRIQLHRALGGSVGGEMEPNQGEQGP